MIWTIAVAILLTVAALTITRSLNDHIDKQTAALTLPAAREVIEGGYLAMSEEREIKNAAELLSADPELKSELDHSGGDAHLTVARESDGEFTIILYNISLGGDDYGLLSVRSSSLGPLWYCGAYSRDPEYRRLSDERLSPEIICEDGIWHPSGP